jgi:hypothetical protein
MRVYVMVWLAMILIVGIEVQLAAAHLPVRLQLVSLLTLAAVEALLGLLFFMQLRYQRRILFWSVVSSLVFVLLMMNQLWPDALRLLALHQ